MQLLTRDWYNNDSFGHWPKTTANSSGALPPVNNGVIPALSSGTTATIFSEIGF